jgi:hypothetical protein
VTKLDEQLVNYLKSEGLSPEDYEKFLAKQNEAKTSFRGKEKATDANQAIYNEKHRITTLSWDIHLAGSEGLNSKARFRKKIIRRKSE